MTRFVPRAALLVAVAGVGFLGGSLAVSQSGDDPEPAAEVEPTTTSTERTATTTVAPHRCTETNTCPGFATTTTTWLPPQDSEVVTPPPSVLVEEAPQSTTPGWYDEDWTCDAACTEDILGGYGEYNEHDPAPTTTTSPPCKPSTFNACDPGEPMELPLFGCDVLETTFSGDVRCLG